MIAANSVEFSYVEKRYGMSDKYDLIIIGAGPGGIFSAYELMKKSPKLKVAVFEEPVPYFHFD